MAKSKLLLDTSRVEIAPSLIDVGENRARRVKRELEGSALLASMAQSGLINPITVTRNGERYALISGYGRLECAKLLGWDRVAATVVEGGAKDIDLLAVGENVGRQDYTIWDQCHAYQNLYVTHGMTPEDIAKRFGRHVKYVQLCLSLPRKLSKKVQAKLDAGASIPTTLLMRWRVMSHDRQDKRLAMWLSGDSTAEKTERRRRIETRTLERYRDLLALAPAGPEKDAVLQSIEYLLGEGDIPTFLNVKG